MNNALITFAKPFKCTTSILSVFGSISKKLTGISSCC